jgi:putative transposase
MELNNLIDNQRNEHPVKTLCKVLGVARSTYYQSHHKVESLLALENKRITRQIIHIHKDSSGRYGAPKIHETLRKQGVHISLKRVQRLMNKASVRSIIQAKYKPYPRSNEKVEDRENLLNQDFSTTTINEKWVADITYTPVLKEGWCYLATVMDLHTKKIVGYSFSKNMTTEIVVKALDNAYNVQRPSAGLILHTDLGTQYTSQEFQQFISKLGMKQSFSQKGCPYDNACIESFHATLKKEEIYCTQYVTFEQANIALFQYIEGWYNRKRIHGNINYKTPQELEEAIKLSA